MNTMEKEEKTVSNPQKTESVTQPGETDPDEEEMRPVQLKRAWELFERGNYPAAREEIARALQGNGERELLEGAKDLENRMSLDRAPVAAWALGVIAWIVIVWTNTIGA